jgi:hypothetical protein
MAAPALSDGEKAQVRAVVFGHLAGIVLAPTVKALWDRRVFDLFEAPEQWVELDRVAEHTHANRGYLRAALRLLASSGWLTQRLERGEPPRYALTPEGKFALSIGPPLYGEALSFISKAIFLEDFLFGPSDRPVLPSLEELVRRSKEGWGLPPPRDAIAERVQGQIRRHLDGILVGPAMVALARGGILAQLEQDSAEVHPPSSHHSCKGYLFDLLTAQGWLEGDKHVLRLTPRGRYAAQIATSYGVTVSYLPLFDNLSTLVFGNARIRRVDDSGVELLVNRGMNVWGSGGAHRTYFKKIDEVIVDIFDRPLAAQPRGICDMGCGDGTLLAHLYSVIKNQTRRGQALDRHPLVLIGADFNKVARRIAKQTLRKADIPDYHVIFGDINRPAQLARDLESLDVDIHDLLHVRSFLDHNRPYLPPADYRAGTRVGRSTGAFAHLGEEIGCDELEESLVRHFRRWAPYVGRFGLLVVELHTLPPELTAENLDLTAAVAYDGTHGFSDQYLVELPIFLDCAREAGLRPDERHQFRFPASNLATVSINFFSMRADEQPERYKS